MDVHAIDSPGASGYAEPTAGLPAFPDPTSQNAAHTPSQSQDETLHNALSQLLGGAKVAVQLKVVPGTHDIVTVFTNADTGQVITQFPPEALVLIGQFFNKLAGAVLDRTA